MDRMLELLAARSTGAIRCTCFVLGWVAERCPELVKRIAAAGHEIASHGFNHELLPSLTPAAFREDLRRSKVLLEDLVGMPVRGYRAPSFSMVDWGVPIVQELGFDYDSSVFAAFAHDRYGSLEGIDAGTSIVELRSGFYEVPVSCLTVGSLGIAWGGGGYFRLLPYPVFRAGVQRILRSGKPYVFYIHPWELDPGQPRVASLPQVARFRHYVGLGRAERRFGALLDDFPWSPIVDVLEHWRAATHGLHGGTPSDAVRVHPC